MAWCRLRRDFRHFKLERIRRLEVLPEQFPARSDFSLSEHLKKESSSEGTMPARVWFTTEAMERVRRDSFSGFVEAWPARGGYEVDFMTFSIEWLARWLLSFGEEAEALSPAALRAGVREAAIAVAQKHGATGEKSS